MLAEYDLDYNYAALGAAIFSKEVLTPERALVKIFGQGEGTHKKPSGGQRKWEMEDALKIDRLRKQGYQWNYIGELYGITAQAAYAVWKRSRKGVKATNDR